MTAGALLAQGIVVALEAALVLLGAGALAWVFRKRSAAVRHAIWAAGLAAALALPLARLVAPPIRVPELAWRRLATGDRVSLPRTSSAERRSLPGRRAEELGPGPLDDLKERGLDLLALALLSLWVSGAATLLARALFDHRRAVRVASSATPIVQGVLIERAAAIARRSRLRRSVVLAETARIRAPATVGVLQPVILLPPEARHWSDAEIDAVLAHEIAHVARRDVLTDLMARIGCAVYWFQPLAWLAARRMSAERELAADDRVLQQGIESTGYASTLIRIARSARGAPFVPSVVPLAPACELEARVRSILDPGIARQPLPRWGLPAIAGIAASLAGPLAALRVAAQAPPTAAMVEPDSRGDSLASPRSELVPGRIGPLGPERLARLLAGPDTKLVAKLVVASGRQPESESDLVAERARWALSVATSDRLIEPLVDALADPDWRVRAYAAWGLAAAGPSASRDPRAVPTLVAALDHPVWRLRAMAAHALREIPSPVAREAMERMLRDDAWQVRVNAVGYLADLGDPSAIAAIRPSLEDRHAFVRMEARQAVLGSRVAR